MKLREMRAALQDAEARALAWLTESEAWADLIGIGALVLAATGIWELWGGAWARIALGAPVAGLYFWLGLRSRLRRG